MRTTLCWMFVGLLGIPGCARFQSPEPAPRIIQLRVLPTSLEMAVGDSATLVGYIAAEPGVTNRIVLWWSTDSLVASVDSRGHVVARRLGTATIVASAAGDPTFKSVSVVGVLSDEPPRIPMRKN